MKSLRLGDYWVTERDLFIAKITKAKLYSFNVGGPQSKNSIINYSDKSWIDRHIEELKSGKIKITKEKGQLYTIRC